MAKIKEKKSEPTKLSTKHECSIKVECLIGELNKILKEKDMKEYKFKTNGVIPKYCEHIVEYGYGCSLQMYLMWRLVNVCDVVLDKKTFSDYCDELGVFIEKQYQLNQNGEEIISHYSSVDMEVELLMMFMYSKFGDKIYVD